PHRTLQNSQEGQSLPPRTPENGVPAPPPARLSEGQGRSALSGADRKARPAPLRAGDHAMFNIITKSIDWAGRTLTLETGKVARQADAAVVATYGETKVLAAVTAARSVKEGLDFFPLTVN